MLFEGRNLTKTNYRARYEQGRHRNFSSSSVDTTAIQESKRSPERAFRKKANETWLDCAAMSLSQGRAQHAQFEDRVKKKAWAHINVTSAHGILDMQVADQAETQNVDVLNDLVRKPRGPRGPSRKCAF